METRQNSNQTRRRTKVPAQPVTSNTQTARRRTNAPAQSANQNTTATRRSTASRPAGAPQRSASSQPVPQRAAMSRRPSTAARKTGSAAQSAARTRKARKPAAQKSAAVTPDVVYTPAAVFSRGQLLVRLVTVVAVVLALVFGISIFFHVDTITVSGCEKYDAWTVKEASGIQIGDNLLSVNDAQVSGNIITKLPYVKNVRVGIKLPNTVNIYIEEQDVVYAIRDTGNLWWLITGEGVVVETTDLATAGEYPQILGIKLYRPESAQQAVAEEPEPQTPAGTTDEGETTPPPITILGSQRLETALDIVQYLEDYQVIDKIVNVDVSDMGNILVQYGRQYQINLGDTTELKYKLELAVKGIPKLDKEYSSPVGTVDVSFRTNSELVFNFAKQTD